VLTVVIAYDLLGGGEAATGALNSAVGVGGLVGALVSGVLVLRRKLGPPLLLGALIAALSVAILGLGGSLALAMIAMAAGSLGGLLMTVVSETLFQRIVPDEIRGRAIGVMSTVSVLMYAAGSLLMPAGAQAIGVGAVLAAGGAALMAAAAITIVTIGPWAVQAPVADAFRMRLTRLPMFEGLAPARLETAERRATLLPMEPGQTIIRQGDPTDRFYVVGEGEVEVTQVGPDGASTVLRRLGIGDGFGEIGLLTGSPRTATVTAVSRGTLVALDGEAFLELVSGAGITSPFVDLQRGNATVTSA
jgi:MFS family permease